MTLQDLCSFFGDFMGVEEDILLLVPDLLGDTGCAPCSLAFCGEVTALSSGESVFCDSFVSLVIANSPVSLWVCSFSSGTVLYILT